MTKQITSIGIFTFITVALKLLYVRLSILDNSSILGFITEISILVLLILLVNAFKIHNTLFILLNVIITVLSLTTIMYFDYYSAIFTYKSLGQLNQVATVSDSVLALIKIKYVLFFLDFLLLGGKKHFYDKKFAMHKNIVRTFSVSAAFLIILGFYHSTKTLSEINKYESIGLVGYQLIEATTTLAHTWREDEEINVASIQKIRNIEVTTNKQFHGIAKDKNVIIVQLESVQDFLLNLEIDGKQVTPYLNTFLKESQYFPNFYTQVGKGNTSDAEFIVNTSIYALGETPMSTAVIGKKVPSLPRTLEQNGYQTATFHANSISFWNREQLYESLGFQEYFDKKYFGTDDIISYGVSDEVFYQKAVEQLAQYKQDGKKFYAHLIALSSHFPYHLPEEKKQLTIKLPEQYRGSSVGAYIEAVSYADYAFGKLVENLKKAGLYDNSIIVVYGDHQGLQTKTDQDMELVHDIFGRPYHTVLDHLNIPLIVKIPSIPNGETVETVGGLVDIYPTVANLLGLDIRNEIVFGLDLLNTQDNLIGIRFYAPTGTYINQIYSFSPGEKMNEGNITNRKTMETTPATKDALKQQEQMLKLLQLSDNYVKTLE